MGAPGPAGGALNKPHGEQQNETQVNLGSPGRSGQSERARSSGRGHLCHRPGHRQGLLRDISEIFTRERLNVVGVNTQSKQGKAHMSFTVEITNLQQMQKTLTLIHEVEGVVGVRRA